MGSPQENTGYSLRGLLFYFKDAEARKVSIIAVTAALCLTFCHYFSITKYGHFFFDTYTANVKTFMGFDNLHRLVFLGAYGVYLLFCAACTCCKACVARKPG